MPLQVGDKVPSVTFNIRKDGDWAELSTDALFTGKRVVVFALPGAFTPTCTATHLSGYLAKHKKVLDAGAHALYCLAVNDSFVMNAWAKDQGIGDAIGMLPDGNADFTKAMGLDNDLSVVGFGVRSKRYAMVVNDGTIEALFVEQGGDVTVSGVDNILDYLG